MTKFDLNSYSTQRVLYNEPSLEDEENYEPYLFKMKYLHRYPQAKDWCDNLEDIIENDIEEEKQFRKEVSKYIDDKIEKEIVRRAYSSGSIAQA